MSKNKESIAVSGDDLVAASMERQASGTSELARFERAQDKQLDKEAGERATKEEMLGADPTPFTRTRDTDDTEVVFYPRPPKLGALPQLMYDVSVSSSDAHSQVELVFSLATTFMYVRDEESGLKRRASVDDISECMNYDDLDMLKNLCSRYLGVTLDSLEADPKK